MSEIRKKDIVFDSADGRSCVKGYFYTCPSVSPRAVLQISHGMCEYIGRYEDFAGYMARCGYVVCGNDHLGHGATSDGPGGMDGFFAEKGGGTYVLQDLHTMNGLASSRFPGLPVILLGHSMGSFFARMYAAAWPDTIAALALSGTGGPNPLGKLGLLLTNVLAGLKGPRYRSLLINNLAFGQYLKRVEHPRTPYDWITRDTAVVSAYAKDPKCTFVFTVSAFHELMAALDAVSSQAWADKLPKDLPVMLFSGDMDPVGDYGKGVRTVYEMLCRAGLRDVSIRLYAGGRHEMLNEINRDEVYTDIRTWCDARVSQK